MTKTELYELLDYVNHSREKRMEMARMVLSNSELVQPLFEIGFDVDNPISSKACWILEFTAREKLAYIFPHLDVFTTGLGIVHFDSSIRPLAKICELLVVSYYSKEKNTTQKALTRVHLESITEACFDWLIGDSKVAPKAYAMTSLLLLGQTFDWIHPELKIIVEQHYATGSAAYKARARMVLAKLK
ncbi:adenylosuccinate lyase [Aggregatimonas sangjinii]|uniref:Adenylosuccinate lyase n=1 Tax=Aggregatimonas sangjinii TaxID=2583587 RepID=A0A5B7SP09_9FLAO|nr:adenylosuccinate lyase [Aggregatimonas sangjinii]QCX00326.1 adenylosuccinate lyase [Aggregatimonas sangjinii]